jgi:hypothetical protein
MKEVLGFLTIVLGILGNIPYILDTFKWKTKPHLFSNLIWLVMTTVVFFGQLRAGAGPGAWTTCTMAIITLFIFLLSFKYGTKDITKVDVVFLVIGLLAIIPWYLTRDPTISVVIATIIDACGFFPTIRKTINDPSSETLSAWVINCIRHGLALFAIANFVLATYIYPIALLIMNMIVVYVIVSGRKNKLKRFNL